MKKKIVGILICTLVITTVGVPMAGSLRAIYKSSPADTGLENFQTKCAWSGEGDNIDNWGITEEIDLSDAISAELEIITLYEILYVGENDYGYVKLSYTGGSNWTILESIQGYTPEDWITMEINLQPWAGKNVLIAFEFKTKADSISDGWWIQQIVVRESHEVIYLEDFSEYNPGDSWGDWTVAGHIQPPNAPPYTPDVTGPKSGSAGTSYIYKVISPKDGDLDGDDIYYYVDWGDDTPPIDWDGPYPPGIPMSVNHTFTSEGTFTISAQARDIHGEVSRWRTLKVSMPRNKITDKQLFLRFLERFIERFPLLERILSLHSIVNR